MSHILLQDERRAAAPASGSTMNPHKLEVPCCIERTDAAGIKEGNVKGNVFATHLTGPILVKNPDFTDFLIRRIFAAKGWELPEALPVLPYEREAYEVTLRELTARAGN